MAADPADPSGTIARPRGELALGICSALVRGPLAVGAAYLGGWPFALFWSLAAIGVFWEWGSLVGGGERRLIVTLGGAALANALGLRAGGRLICGPGGTALR